MGYVDEKEDTEKECESIMVIMAAIFFLIYAALLALGVIYFVSCEDNRIALYSVVQGVTVMFNTVMFATCLVRKLVSRKVLFFIGSPILLFNLGWSVQGALWMYVTLCPKNALYWYAVASSVPMWIIVGLYCFSYWCC